MSRQGLKEPTMLQFYSQTRISMGRDKYMSHLFAPAQPKSGGKLKEQIFTQELISLAYGVYWKL